MAEVIEIYVPANFRKNEKLVPFAQRGKVLEFPVPMKKSA